MQKYITRLTEKVEEKIQQKLPQSFGLIIDGWSHNAVHYVAVFAVFEGEGALAETPLLAIAPLLREEDRSAKGHFDYIVYLLSVFNRNLSSVAFLVSDNQNLNRNLASEYLRVPMVGCASHRLNLAVKHYLKPHEDLLTKIQSLMKNFSPVRNALFCGKKIFPQFCAARQDGRAILTCYQDFSN